MSNAGAGAGAGAGVDEDVHASAGTQAISGADLTAALGALERAGVLTDLPGATLTPVSGGTSGRTFHLRDADGTPHWTVRFARPGGSDRLAWEAQVLQDLHAAARQAAAAGPTLQAPSGGVANEDAPDAALPPLFTTASSAPPPVPAAARALLPDDPLLLTAAELPGGQLLVHRHVPGAPRDLRTCTPEEFTVLGQALGWLHEQPRSGYAIWPDFRERPGTRADAVQARIASLDAWLHPDDPAADAFVAALRDLPLHPQAGWQEPWFSLLHGDLSPGNLLWETAPDGTPQVHLIDWEYTRAGDPAEELAYLISEGGLSPEQVATLADAWLEVHDDPWALARLPVWLPFVAVDSALWWHAYARNNPHLDVRAQIAERDAVAQRVLAGGHP